MSDTARGLLRLQSAIALAHGGDCELAADMAERAVEALRGQALQPAAGALTVPQELLRGLVAWHAWQSGRDPINDDEGQQAYADKAEEIARLLARSET